MKKWKTCLSMGILLAVTAVGASGCDKLVHTTVIAEQSDGEGRTQAAGHSLLPSKGAESISEQVKAPEKYTVNASWDQVLMMQDYVDNPQEEQLMTAGIYTGDVTQADQGTADEASRNMAEQHITLIADADIKVPEAESIHLKKVSAASLPKETYERWLKVLGGEMERDQEDDREELKNTFTVNQIPYTVSDSYLSAAAEEDTENLKWFYCSADWSSIARTEDGWKNIETGERITVTDQNTEDCRQKADQLLQDLGLSDFSFSYASEGEATFGWQDIGDVNDLRTIPYITLIYERVEDGIPITETAGVAYPLYQEEISEDTEEQVFWGPEYLSVEYVGGNLTCLAYTGIVEVSDYSDEDLFLLPFEEIRQIFENTIGEKMLAAGSSAAGIPENLDEMAAVWIQYPDAVFDNVTINIHKVKLGYMRVREDETLTAGAEEGLLIPVWDFFGTWTASSTQEDGKTVGEKLEKEEVSLLTIDARDGTVLQRMVGY